MELIKNKDGKVIGGRIPIDEIPKLNLPNQKLIKYDHKKKRKRSDKK